MSGMLWLSVAVVSVVVLHCSSWERSNPPLQIEISEAHRIQKFRVIQGIASEILWRLCQDCPMSKDRSLIMNLRRAAAVRDSTAKQLLAKGCLLHRVSSMTSLHSPYDVWVVGVVGAFWREASPLRWKCSKTQRSCTRSWNCCSQGP